ncbi:unnamed protein product [Pleuronectes platessa]|uniref:Uncharacterized protein n=1 Tax=Pleuronectes platessa TaxID=8262 RepID=A0A9N7VP30_PLEPL|nr:unnamed protein product [Pleuronectes platessa]
MARARSRRTKVQARSSLKRSLEILQRGMRRKPLDIRTVMDEMIRFMMCRAAAARFFLIGTLLTSRSSLIWPRAEMRKVEFLFSAERVSVRREGGQAFIRTPAHVTQPLPS